MFDTRKTCTVCPICAAEPLSYPATWDIEILTSASLLPLGAVPIRRVGKLTSTAAGVNIQHLNMHREQHNYITLFSGQKRCKIELGTTVLLNSLNNPHMTSVQHDF